MAFPTLNTPANVVAGGAACTPGGAKLWTHVIDGCVEGLVNDDFIVRRMNGDVYPGGYQVTTDKLNDYTLVGGLSRWEMT